MSAAMKASPTIIVDRQKFMEDGYLILQNVVPPEQLDGLRASFEELVERQKTIWAQEAGPEDPPGGLWETGEQPRLAIGALADESTADTVDFCLHENTLGVGRQLMHGTDVGVHQLALMCSPQRDHGPAKWHRDTGPTFDPPLQAVELDMMANGPAYVQWNIPLYDDDVLWVVPGSHRRANTDEENRQLVEDPMQPLPSGVPVELNAGDGVVYTNFILHWGSNYSTKFRRTIHNGYQSFGGPLYRYFWVHWWDTDFIENLPRRLRKSFERWNQCVLREHDIIESIYCAILDKDTVAFGDTLAELHPGEEGRIVPVMLLCKVAQLLYLVAHPELEGDLINTQRRFTTGTRRALYEDISRRFTPNEIDTLWRRFRPLDAALQTDEPQNVAGTQSEPSPYRVYEMPPKFGIEEFILSWND